MKNFLAVSFFLLSGLAVKAQDGFNTPSIGVHTGVMNYQGDLNPNSFTFKNSHPFLSFYISQPITTKLNFRGGVTSGKIEADDKNNRGYLVPRNLNFKSNITDAYAGFEWNVIDPSKTMVTPFIFLGAAVFHFDPWTLDEDGSKVYLQALSTEGQGLTDYPDRHPYKLTQLAVIYAGGLRFTASQNVSVAIELSQRKTFTDYLDDVSSSYADRDKLLAAKGPQAVRLAFRGDELNGDPYPKAGEQRGTPTENDWYYMVGVSMQVRLNSIKEKLTALKLSSGKSKMGCPSIF